MCFQLIVNIQVVICKAKGTFRFSFPFFLMALKTLKTYAVGAVGTGQYFYIIHRILLKCKKQMGQV